MALQRLRDILGEAWVWQGGKKSGSVGQVGGRSGSGGGCMHYFEHWDFLIISEIKLPQGVRKRGIWGKFLEVVGAVAEVVRFYENCDVFINLEAKFYY